MIFSKIVKFLTIAFLLVMVGLFGFFYNAYQEVKLDTNKIINYHPAISSEILDRNGVRLAYIFKKQHRLYANFDEIPPLVIETLIATEDTRFFEHKGINPDSILRAVIADIKARRFVEGGSTLTQQLVKNSLLTSKKKLTRKIKEAILAIKLEKVLSKEQIIERYLNAIPYANNYYGIKTAAQGYFRKNLKDLTLKEIAILIAIPNAPSYYNPRRHYKRVLKRANTILARLRKLGWISKEEYQKAKKEKPKIYKTTLTQNIAPYIVDEVVRRLKKKFPDIKSGGYKIYTTIDIKLQNAAKKDLLYGYQRAIKRFKRGKKHSKLNGALIAVDNKSGDILAMVGGISYKESAFNRVTMAKRQPGSTFKPFIYQIALDMGYNPASPLPDIKRTFVYTTPNGRKVWFANNYERNFRGLISLREALVHSVNAATVNLVCDIGGVKGCKRGVEIIRDRLKLLDIKNIPNDLSIALGNLSVTPLKMAQMYTVFSNYGHMIEPRLINKILSKENVILYETKPKEILNFTKPSQAYLMTSILKDVIKRGTGKNAKVDEIELAGKTGTTNLYVDAWFCGYSPEITAVVWFGRDNNLPIGKGATGGAVAAPVFKKLFQNILKIYPNTKRVFTKPEGVFEAEYNGKIELFTKESPLPKKEHYDLMDDDYRPKLHPIGESANEDNSLNYEAKEQNETIDENSSLNENKNSLESNISIREEESPLPATSTQNNNEVETIDYDTQVNSGDLDYSIDNGEMF